MPTDDGAPEALPPAHLPAPWLPAIGPVILRPLTLADNTAAFVLSEIAFATADHATAEATAARQRRWVEGGRAWFGWLHARADGHAWAATRGANGPLVGYARVIRDEAARREQLTELFVHPQFQGGQVGKALLAAALPPTMPAGWGRVIIADPSFPALALYQRWGVFPLGVAWHGRITLPHGVTFPVEHPSNDTSREDVDAFAEHVALRGFLCGALGATVHTSAAGGYGVRCGDALGPVVGATPADALALVQTLLTEARAAGIHTVDLWVPGANISLLRWLAAWQPRWDGQVTLLASDPALVARMDRTLLVAPPYLW